MQLNCPTNHHALHIFAIQRDGSALVNLPRSKTDQEGEGDFRPLSVATASALRAWLGVAGIDDGAIWRTIAQDLLEANYSAPSIMVAGGWKTERMVVRYGRKLNAGRNAMAPLQRQRQG